MYSTVQSFLVYFNFPAFDILKYLFTTVEEMRYHNNPEPVFKIIKWKIPVVTTESFCDSTQRSRLIPWRQCGIHEKGTRFRKFIKKKRLFYGNSYYEKEEGTVDHNSFAQVSVQKIREMDTKVVAKCQCVCPNTPKLCLWIRFKKVDSFPHFFVLNTGSGFNPNTPEERLYYFGLVGCHRRGNNRCTVCTSRIRLLPIRTMSLIFS